MGYSGVSAQLLDGLNDEQVAAVTHLSGPLLVVAGPGSGKTRVLTRRTAALLEAGVAPWRVAAVTFTNRAAAEMRDRLDALVGEQAAGSVNVSTFHSLCVKVLRRYHDAAGLPKTFTIADSRDSLAVLSAAATDAGVVDDLSGTEQVELVRRMRKTISWAKNAGVASPQEWSPPAGDGPDTARVWAAYEAVMAASGMVDFDDLLVKVAQLGADPTVGPLLAGRFDRLLVDEYQDTNAVQQRLTELFAGPGGQVCAVGDPDQSVYAFRGATGSVAEEFLRRWPDACVVKLGRNYRSTVTICDVSASVIAPNPAKHRATVTAVDDSASAAPVVMLVADDPLREAEWAARTVAAKVAASPPSFTAAVLVRANHQTRPLEKALASAGVRHALLGTLRFSDRAEVKDVMAWLRLATNPHDQVAMVRAAGCPRRGLGPVATAGLRQSMADGQPVVAAAEQLAQSSPRARAAALSFAAAVDEVAAACRRGPAAALAAVLDSVGVRQAAVGSGEGAAEREENISELVSYAASFDAGDGLAGVDAVAAFCEALSLASSDSSGADGSQAPPQVVISTIHAAKGKEFDWVMVAGCEEDVLPHSRSGSPAGIEEERRLMFVACSRARHDLVLSRCVERMTFGKVSRNGPSRFLADVPAGLSVTVHTPEQRQADAPGSGWVSRRRSAPPPPRKVPVPVPGRVFAAGAAVSHTKFGAGVVVEHLLGDGQVQVRFGDGRTRLFVDSTPMLTLM